MSLLRDAYAILYQAWLTDLLLTDIPNCLSLRFGEENSYLSLFYGEENPLRNEFRITVNEDHLEEFEGISFKILDWGVKQFEVGFLDPWFICKIDTFSSVEILSDVCSI